MKRLYYICLIIFVTFSLTACAASGGSTKYSGSAPSDNNARLSKLEEQVRILSNQNLGPAAADSWNQSSSFKDEINVLRNQIVDLNNRLDGSGSGGTMAQEVSNLKARVVRLETALQEIVSKLGLEIESLTTPIPTYSPSPVPNNPYQQSNNTYSQSPNPYQQGNPVYPQTTTATNNQNPYAEEDAAYNDEETTVIINGQPRQIKPGNPPEAIPALATANSSTDTAATLYEQGSRAFQDRKYSEALTAFKDFTTNYPKHNLASNAWFWQGECYFQLKEHPRAIISYQEVIEKFPQSNKLTSSLLKQGISFIRSGNKDAGKVRLEELIKKYPKTPEATRAKSILSETK